MERRELLGLAGAGAAGLWTAGVMGAVDDKKDKEHKDDHKGKAGDKREHEHEHGEDEHGEDEHGGDHGHMKIVGECAAVCVATMRHCVEKLKEDGGKNREAHAKAVIFTNDCASFCGHHLALMVRHSPLSHIATQACADACRDCAKACDEGGDDEVMKKCAEICRECEKACRAHLAESLKKKS